jgi:hypothetical protein
VTDLLPLIRMANGLLVPPATAHRLIEALGMKIDPDQKRPNETDDAFLERMDDLYAANRG